MQFENLAIHAVIMRMLANGVDKSTRHKTKNNSQQNRL